MVAAQQLMPGLTGELDVLLAAREVCSVFQPTADLGTGEPVAFVALACGPAGSVLRLPDVLFETAHSAGRVHELDRLCQRRALESALDAGLAAVWIVRQRRTRCGRPDRSQQGCSDACAAGDRSDHRAGPDGR